MRFLLLRLFSKKNKVIIRFFILLILPNDEGCFADFVLAQQHSAESRALMPLAQQHSAKCKVQSAEC